MSETDAGSRIGILGRAAETTTYWLVQAVRAAGMLPAYLPDAIAWLGDNPGIAAAIIDHAVHPDPLVPAVQLWRCAPDLPLIIVGEAIPAEIADDAQDAGVFAVLSGTAASDLGAALRLAQTRTRGGRPEFTRALARTLCTISSLASDAVDASFTGPALESIAALFRAPQASVLLFDDPSRPDAVLTVAAQVGLPPGIVARTQIRRGEGVAGRVAATGVPQVLLRDLERNPGFTDIPARHEVTASICVPIRAPRDKAAPPTPNATVLGVLSIARKRNGSVFTPRDLDVCDSIAAHLGEALARLEGERRGRELQERMAAVEKLSYAGELAAGIAHEIANPVAVLRSNLEALSSYLDDLAPAFTAIRKGASGEGEEAAALLADRTDLVTLLDDLPDLMEDCRASVQRTHEIVLQTKSLVRIDSSSSPAQPEQVPAARLIHETLRLLRPRLQARAQIVVHAEADVVIHGHAVELGQILVNLVINAFDACDERREREARADGGAAYRPEVTLVARTDLDRCILTVADNGIGIPEGQLRRIFAPLFTTKPAGIGTGLGLGIVRRIVESHHGQLTVESSPGKGTQFTVVLPIGPLVGPGVTEPRGNEGAALATGSSPSAPQAPR